MRRTLCIVFLAAMAAAIGCGNQGQTAQDWGWGNDTSADVANADVATADTADAIDPADTRTDTNNDTQGTQDMTEPTDATADADETPQPDIAPEAGEPDQGLATDTGETVEWTGPNLAGSWAQLNVSSTITRSITGESYSITVSVSLLDIAQSGADLVVKTDLCDLRIDNSNTLSPVKTKVPSKFIMAIPTVDKPAVISCADESCTFTQPPFVEVWGAVLTNPETDPLPTKDDDSRVIDQDNDEQPGMTIQMTGLVAGDLYLVQRRITSTAATLDPQINETIDGLITFTNEMNFIGTSNPSLMNSLPERFEDKDPSHSYFRTTRIDQAWNCANILQNRDTLFDRPGDDQ